MNIATQAQAFLNGLMTDKTSAKWIEKLVTSYLPLGVTLLLILMLASNAAQLTFSIKSLGSARSRNNGRKRCSTPAASKGRACCKGC